VLRLSTYLCSPTRPARLTFSSSSALHRVRPAAGQGVPAPERPAPRFGVGRAHRRVWPGSRRSPTKIPVSSTPSASRSALILNANAPNLGSMYVLLKEVLPAPRPADRRRDRGPTGGPVSTRCGAIVSAFGAPPIDAWARRVIQADRRGRATSPGDLQRVSDQSSRRQQDAGLRLFNSSRPIRVDLPRDRPDKCMALGPGQRALQHLQSTSARTT